MARRAERPKKRRKGKGYARVVWILLGVVVCALLAGAGWLLLAFPDQRGPGRGRVVELEIAPGERVEQVARELVAVGALAEPQAFALHARLRGAQARLRSGTVLLYDSMTPRELLQRVARDYGSADLRVVIPEGFSRFEIATRLARWGICDSAAFLAATEDQELLRALQIEGTSAEGWLFPDTYQLRDDLQARALVERFVRNARRRMAAVFEGEQPGAQRLLRDLGWREAQVVTLASIVEKEAAVASEQPIIAGVFLNRLRSADFRPKRLQADPTVLYGCAAQPQLASCSGLVEKQITRRMLSGTDNPYNTYTIEGLPPGPIANPGLAALRAVLAPAAHDYFYFVASGGTRHTFSRTLEEHHAAIARIRGR